MQTATTPKTGTKPGNLIENLLLVVIFISGLMAMIYLFKASETDMRAEIEEHLVSVELEEEQQTFSWQL